MAMRVPWKDVVRAAPMVLRAADRLLRRDTAMLDRYDSSPTLGSLAERVERLEAASVAHADVARDIAEEVNQLSRALRSLAIQAAVAIALAAAALGVAIVALVRTLVVVLVISATAHVLWGAAAADAQSAPQQRARVAFLGNADRDTQASSVVAFREGLREAGLVDGQNVRIDYRWAEGHTDRVVTLAGELVRLKPDVIVASGSSALRAVQQLTTTVPVVTVILVDPVAGGFAASLARPGGNITGVASQYEEIVTKQVQLLAAAVPKLTRLVLLDHGAEPKATGRSAVAAAESIGVKAQLIEVGDVNALDGALRAAHDQGAQAILVLPSPFWNANRRTLVRLAATHHLPALYEFRVYVQDGGLMSYGPSLDDMYRRAASFVGRIVAGAKPGDLPIERPSKFELVINRKTASALGLTIPQTLLLQADQLID